MKKLALLFLLSLFASTAFAQQSIPGPSGRSVGGTLTSDITTTSPTTVLSAPPSGYKYYLYFLGVTNSSATGTVVTMSCGAANSAKMRLYAPAGLGFMAPLTSPIPCETDTAVTLTAATTSAALQGSVTAWIGK